MSEVRYKRRNGMPDLIHVGLPIDRFTDVYHSLLVMSWWRFLALLFVAYVTVNAIFASLYLAGGDCFGAPNPGSVIEAFAFSVQTISGIGYGAMAPSTHYAHLVSMTEAFFGLVFAAMVTGVCFAKFARPIARVRFSQVMVVHDYDGVPTLFFRMANLRSSQIVDAHIHVTALIRELTREGEEMSRLHEVKLERAHSPVFTLSWTAMHRLTEDSPLHPYLCGTSDMVDPDFRGVFATLIGMDESMNQTIHAQALYRPDSIRVGHRFVDMMDGDSQTKVIIDHRRIDDIEPFRPAAVNDAGEDSAAD